MAAEEMRLPVASDAISPRPGTPSGRRRSPSPVQTPTKPEQGQARRGSSLLDQAKVQNTFINFGSPLRTVHVTSPPKTVPSNFAPEAQLVDDWPLPCTPTAFGGGMGHAPTPWTQAFAGSTPLIDEIGQKDFMSTLGPAPPLPPPFGGAAVPAQKLRLSDFLPSPTPAGGGDLAALEQQAQAAVEAAWQNFEQVQGLMSAMPPLPGSLSAPLNGAAPPFPTDFDAHAAAGCATLWGQADGTSVPPAHLNTASMAPSGLSQAMVMQPPPLPPALTAPVEHSAQTPSFVLAPDSECGQLMASFAIAAVPVPVMSSAEAMPALQSSTLVAPRVDTTIQAFNLSDALGTSLLGDSSSMGACKAGDAPAQRISISAGHFPEPSVSALPFTSPAPMALSSA